MLRLEMREMTDIRQDEDMQALAQEIQKEYERRREERRGIELGWRLNQNFLMGNQYCDVLYETGELIEEAQGAEWENRAVYNMIAPIVETRLAKLSRVRPGMTVRPLKAAGRRDVGGDLRKRVFQGGLESAGGSGTGSDGK